VDRFSSTLILNKNKAKIMKSFSPQILRSLSSMAVKRTAAPVSAASAEQLFKSQNESATAIFRNQRAERLKHLKTLPLAPYNIDSNTMTNTPMEEAVISEMEDTLKEMNDMHAKAEMGAVGPKMNKRTGRPMYTMVTPKSTADLYREHRTAVLTGLTTAPMAKEEQGNKQHSEEKEKAWESQWGKMNEKWNNIGVWHKFAALLAMGVGLESAYFYSKESKKVPASKAMQIYKYVWELRLEKVLSVLRSSK